MIRKLLSFAALLSVAGCGEAPSSPTGTAPSTPTEQLAEVNRAYAENAVQAQRDWGGKRLTLGGSLHTAGKNPDGTISILLKPGSELTLGELRFDAKHADFVAGLDKGASVTAECTVDPNYEGVSGATMIDCTPAGTKEK